MAKFYALLSALIIVNSVVIAQAAPQDLPGTIYIDGVPCNLPCQSYMGWSRQQLSGRTTTPVPRADRASRIAKPSSKPKTQRIAKSIVSRPSNSAPSRASAENEPAVTRSAPMVAADPPSSQEEGKIANDSPAVLASPSPTRPDAGNDQATTGPADTATATPEQEKQAKTNTEPVNPAAPRPSTSNDTTAALAPPDTTGEMVAILLVRSGIKSASDLANKVIAIDEGSADYSVAELKQAIVAAGASDIQLSEDAKMALVRVLDGDVPAAVATVMPSKAAEVWNAGVSGFNVLRIPLPTVPQKAKRG